MFVYDRHDRKLWNTARWQEPAFDKASAVREITKSSSTFSATNISSNIVWLLQLQDTTPTKSHFSTEFSSIYLAKWEKRLVFRVSCIC